MKCYVDSCGYVRVDGSNDVALLSMVFSQRAINCHVCDGWLLPSAVKRVSYQRGYVSRHDFDVLSAPVRYSRRLKLFYVLVPCWHTTQYCRRFYLDPDMFNFAFAVDSASLR